MLSPSPLFLSCSVSLGVCNHYSECLPCLWWVSHLPWFYCGWFWVQYWVLFGVIFKGAAVLRVVEDTTVSTPEVRKSIYLLALSLSQGQNLANIYWLLGLLSKVTSDSFGAFSDFVFRLHGSLQAKLSSWPPLSHLSLEISEAGLWVSPNPLDKSPEPSTCYWLSLSSSCPCLQYPVLFTDSGGRETVGFGAERWWTILVLPLSKAQIFNQCYLDLIN